MTREQPKRDADGGKKKSEDEREMSDQGVGGWAAALEKGLLGGVS